MKTIVEKDGLRRACSNQRQVDRYLAQGYKLVKSQPKSKPEKPEAPTE